MVLLITAIVLSVLAFLGILLGTLFAADNKAWSATSVLGFGFMLILLFGKFTTISANSVGIVYNDVKGGIQDTTYGEGFHVKSIYEHITQISTANRSASVTTTGQTNDGQYATFTISIIYRIDKNDAGKFYRIANDKDIPSEQLNAVVKETLQKETIQHNIFKLLSDELEDTRDGFETGLKDALLEKYFITLVGVSFDEIDGGEEVEGILQDLAKAEQEIAIAEAQALAVIKAAEGEAEAQKLIADAQAYAIQLLGEANAEAANAYVEKVQALIDSLYAEMSATMTYEECTAVILGVIFYDNWDGQLPEVLTSDSLSALIGSLIGG